MRKTGPNSDEAIEARRRHAAKRIEVFLLEVISTSPPLAADEKRQIVALLDTGAEALR